MIAALLLLSACSAAELYTDQSERHANEMVAVLRTAGIDASKHRVDSQNGASWTVTAPEADFPRATRLLSAQGYPRQAFDSLGTIFKKQGFVSSPFEERARLNYAIAQELEHTISIIDGVIENRVHVTQPERDPLSDAVRAASASVVIRYRPGANLEGQVGQIRAIVVDAVEGLTPDRVTVLLTPAQPLALAQRPPAGLPWWAGGAGLVALVGGGLAWQKWRRRGGRDLSMPAE
jgi:type III secretion protein J